MKSYLFRLSLSLLLILVASFFCAAQSSDDIHFEKTTQKFRKVDEGHQLTFTYTFTYTGKKEIGISNKEIDCSCTTISYSNLRILPNSTNKIIIKFDTNDKIGWQEREVVIQFMGTHSEISSGPYFEKILTFKGNIKANKATKEAYKLNQNKK